MVTHVTLVPRAYLHVTRQPLVACNVKRALDTLYVLRYVGIYPQQGAPFQTGALTGGAPVVTGATTTA